ncbi:Rieske 2Fe-2S domain-containing protein [Paraburkholderia dinghuensis]|uniref:(2Fe-2S)-binding protein n=1 Tax=Paraburkholderia dinghuensis TaxID=2305225 RepID=A0A3N6MM88_9BURK|nr:Rieske 2Fe-2S domain-containing protein [Paraburkholderia dinghuensis]RQH04944.1 (2Fe-2S)-binding protein [Paraburkholderia dinghuensis]
MATGSWWAAALSESVDASRPLAVVCNGEALVLFRDASGAACALEDRCPHRRVPLSLGKVTQKGLQCGYHGWTFDGKTGACTAIPNLRADERVPPRYGARSYRVAEAGGFMHVWLGDGEPDDAPLPGLVYHPQGEEHTGASIVNVAAHEYQDAMLDGPDCLVSLDGVRMTDFFLGDARTEDGWLTVDRGAVWKTRMLPPAFVTDHPLIVRTSVSLAGGAALVALLDADETPLVTVFVASSANRRGTTSLCWRGFWHDARVAGAPLRWQIARATGRSPFRVREQIDGAALAALLVAPSRDLAAARAEARAPIASIA